MELDLENNTIPLNMPIFKNKISDTSDSFHPFRNDLQSIETLQYRAQQSWHHLLKNQFQSASDTLLTALENIVLSEESSFPLVSSNTSLDLNLMDQNNNSSSSNNSSSNNNNNMTRRRSSERPTPSPRINSANGAFIFDSTPVISNDIMSTSPLKRKRELNSSNLPNPKSTKLINALSKRLDHSLHVSNGDSSDFASLDGKNSISTFIDSNHLVPRPPNESTTEPQRRSGTQTPISPVMSMRTSSSASLFAASTDDMEGDHGVMNHSPSEKRGIHVWVDQQFRHKTTGNADWSIQYNEKVKIYYLFFYFPIFLFLFICQYISS